ncbi:MBL fold metallo-hydrolase [Salegentibacter sp. F188]|uniref:MBL fold metallo-hydrolase n=1 Tax=Autumnicola patrickiae TaxID=3075591 RepID=A0ABU3DXE1_9FLAO|nr:MBL fold metallo-hydrolase [Salegentibacter sp. F188]MDT0688389.1 MBL fold metallo-hydrolase [Salegentibacter sp. F188]
MKKIFTLLTLGILLVSCKNEQQNQPENDVTEMTGTSAMEETDSVSIDIEPISHATAVFKWGDAVFYTDPVGGAEAFSGAEDPDFILITDIHGDHMDAETLQALELDDSLKIIVPQAVKDQLPAEMENRLVVMNNGESIEHMGFTIEAIPMYNLPEAEDAMHVKGRGNGYVLEKDGKRLYISGDTEDIPEMRNLQNIDVALVSMNLPYTMPVDQAAEGVVAFAPEKVYPYHYRGQDGLADVEKFKELVNQENEDIEVVLADWYPERK